MLYSFYLPFLIPILVQVDPTPFTAWGVLGLLGFAFLIVMGIVYNLVTKQVARQVDSSAAQNKAFMDFMGSHGDKFTKVLEQVTDKQREAISGLSSSIRESNKDLTYAFNRQANLLDRMLLSRNVIQEIKEMNMQGKPLDTEAIERAITRVMERHKAEDSTRS